MARARAAPGCHGLARCPPLHRHRRDPATFPVSLGPDSPPQTSQMKRGGPASAPTCAPDPQKADGSEIRYLLHRLDHGSGQDPSLMESFVKKF